MSLSSLPAIDPRYLATRSSSRSLEEGSPRHAMLSSQRWQVVKQRESWEGKLAVLYDQQAQSARRIDRDVTEKADKLFNAIIVEMKVSNPPLPQPQRNLIKQYCQHLLQRGSTEPFPNESDLRAWQAKNKGTRHEKWTNKIHKMCKRLFDLLAQRDERLVTLQNDLLLGTEELTIKRDASLRWTMEKLSGQRDVFFSLWQLARRNAARQLAVLIASEAFQQRYPAGLDEPDPDYGLTALHYACRGGHADTVNFLLQRGALVDVRGPDGRTALHFAAAYASREIVISLLAAGAQVDSEDIYHCRPLDLAQQNNNEATAVALRRWALPLRGPEEEKEVEEKEEQERPAGLGEVPSEFLPLSREDFQAMSPALQLLAHRLNAFNPHLLLLQPSALSAQAMLSSTFALRAEPQQGTQQQEEEEGLYGHVRLLTRFYLLCLEEGFLSLAMQALRRRWLVAQILLSRLATKKQEQQEEQQQEVEEEESLASEEPPPPPTTTTKQEEAVVESAVSLERLAARLASVQHITYLPPSPRLPDDCYPSPSPSPSATLQRWSQTIFAEEQQEQQQVSGNTEGSIGGGGGGVVVGEGGGGGDGSGSHAAEAIEDFLNLERVRRLQAYPWQHESTSLLDHYTVFSQTAAHSHGHSLAGADENSSLRSELYSLLSSLPPPRAAQSLFCLVKLGLELAQVALVRREVKLCWQTLEDCLGHYAVPAAENEGEKVAGSRRLISPLVRAELLFLKCELLLHFFDNWQQHGETMAALIMQAVTTASSSAFPLSSPLEAASSLWSSDTDSSIQFACLTLALAVAQEALDLSYLSSTHLLVEPFSSSIALEQIARIHERQGQGYRASIAMEQALVMALRADRTRPETVRIAVESLRLFVKYGLCSSEEIGAVAAKSREVFAVIEACHAAHSAAFDVAQKVEAERRCSELLALATVMHSDYVEGLHCTSTSVQVTGSIAASVILASSTSLGDADQPPSFILGKFKSNLKTKDKTRRTPIHF